MTPRVEPRLLAQVAAVQPGTARFESVLALAARVLAQDRHLTSGFPAAQESCVLGALTAPDASASCAI